MIIEKHLIVQKNDSSVLDMLKNDIDLSTTQIKKSVQNGCLWLEDGKQIKRIRRLKKLLKTGQKLHYYYNEQIQQQEPQKARLIDDNNEWSVWYKPRGMLSQGSKWGDHTTLYRYAETVLLPQRKAYLVHRLDKMTCGLIILAHSKNIAAAFTKQFEQREIKKTYRAVVEGYFHFQAEPLILDDPIDGRNAKSKAMLLDYNQETNLSLVEISISTGRKHQIRRHLSYAGFPILGDRLYGSGKSTQDLQLEAASLVFNCPVRGEEKAYSTKSELINITVYSN